MRHTGRARICQPRRAQSRGRCLLMLGALLQYAQDHDLVAEPGFAPKLVRWALICDTDGRFLEVLDLATEGSRGRTFRKCPELSQPEMKHGGAGCRHFLI